MPESGAISTMAETAQEQPVPASIVRDQLEVIHRERRVRWLAIGLTLAAAVALVSFIAWARVPVGAGWREGRALRVRKIWTLFTHEVAAVAGTWLSTALITGLVVVLLAGCVVGLYLAMTVRDERSGARAE